MQKFLQKLAAAQQEEPARTPAAPLHDEGGAVPGSPSSCQFRDVQGDPVSLSSSEDDEDPRPKMATAFDKAIWPTIDNVRRQSVA